MANKVFERLSIHNAIIKGVNKVIWRIRITGTIDEYYIRADQAHSKLGGGYWVDSKHLISLNKIIIPEAFESQRITQQMPTSYANVKCGQCGIINLVNLENLKNAQGVHHCRSCKSTICLIIDKQLNLKNGSKVDHITTH